VEKPRAKSNAHYDDDTLERMKLYYKIEGCDELLRFIKTHGLQNEDDGSTPITAMQHAPPTSD